MSVHEYLQKNNCKLNLNELDSFKMLKEELPKYDVFFTGEEHGIKANSVLQFAFLKFFVLHAGVKYVLIEGSYSRADFLNHFLRSGDEKVLLKLYKSCAKTSAYTKESLTFWRNLHQFNKTLPKNRRIEVIGVDLEFQFGTAISFMESLIKKNQDSQKIEKMLERLQSIKDLPKAELKNSESFFSELSQHIKNHKSIWEDATGERLWEFELVNNNIMESLKLKGSGIERDKTLYSNFLKIMSHKKKGKFYGQFGSQHVCLHSLREQTPFGAYLNGDKTSPVRGKVLSVWYRYVHCNMLFKDRQRNFYNKKINNSQTVFIPFLNSKYHLFKLNGHNPPNKDLSSTILGEKFDTFNVTNFYQYILVISNSNADSLFDEKDFLNLQNTKVQMSNKKDALNAHSSRK